MRIVSWLPDRWVRALGRLQFRLPIVGPLILLVGRRLLAGPGVIRSGLGAGLRFDASGGAPGYLLGSTELEEQAILARYLGPGDVFYDIGASVGFFSMLAARLVGPDGRVYAFEPFPASAATLRKNAEANGFAHVEVVEAAVAASAGEAMLWLNPLAMANSLVVTHDGKGIRVAVLSLDGFFQERHPPPPKLIKIDVEGAEIEALKGMETLLREHRPTVLCEIHGGPKDLLAHCAGHLAPLGYTVQPVEEGAQDEPHQWLHVLLVPAADTRP